MFFNTCKIVHYMRKYSYLKPKVHVFFRIFEFKICQIFKF